MYTILYVLLLLSIIIIIIMGHIQEENIGGKFTSLLKECAKTFSDTAVLFVI